jgi:hypothetical protein
MVDIIFISAIIIAFIAGFVIGFLGFACMISHEFESKMFCPVCERMKEHT